MKANTMFLRHAGMTVFSLQVRHRAGSDKVSVPTLPVPSADILKNVHLTVHFLKIKSYLHS